MSESNPARRERGMSLTAKQSWDERAKMALGLIGEKLKARKLHLA